MFVDYNNTLNYWFSCEHKHPLIDSQYCTHNILVAQVYWENQEPTCYDNFACLCLVCIIQEKDWKFNLIIKISKHFASRSILTRKFCSPNKKNSYNKEAKANKSTNELSVCLKTSLDAIIVQNCLQFFPFFQHWKLILSGPDFLSTSE